MANLLVTASLSLIFSFLPILIAVIPVLLFRKSRSIQMGIYRRSFLAFLVFWLLYILFPAGLNFTSDLLDPVAQPWEDIKYYELSPGSFSSQWEVGDHPDLLVRYLFQLTLNSFVLFLQYPLQILPFVFVISPLVAFFVLIYRLRREEPDKTLRQKLQMIQYDIETSPGEQILDRMVSKDWSTEREMFKILLAMLPISLYLLMTLLKWLEYEEQSSILKGTSLGWFLEMFFVYLATAIFSVHLLAAGGFSFKGIYVGRRMRESLFQSLSTVGLFISVIAIVLFVLDFSNQLATVIYFSVYFIMTALFFILFLDVFEPLSVFFLTKIIEYAKAFEKKKLRFSAKKVGLILSIAFTINIIISLMDFSLRVFLVLFIGFDQWESLPVQIFYHVTIALVFLVILTASTLIFRRWNWNALTNSYMVFIAALAFGFLWNYWYFILGYNGSNNLNPWPGYPIEGEYFLLQPTLFSTFITTSAGTIESWLTSVFRFGYFNGELFIIPEIFEVPVLFAPILGLGSLPYRILYGFSTIVLYGLLIFYLSKKFAVYITQLEHVEGQEKVLEKIIYSERDVIPEMSAALSNPNDFIFKRNFEDYPPEGEEPPGFDENDPKYDMVNNLCQFDFGETVVEFSSDIEPISLEELGYDSGMTVEQVITFFNTVNRSALGEKRPFTFYQKEYGFTYEEVALDSLHVMMTDGRSVFMHNFTEESKVEPALVSGLFAAITSFAKEAVQSEELLRTIDHGDVVLIIEYGRYVFTAIFADRNSATIRKTLR
ncbi:MAG: hypothetical protein ACFFD4_20545, partial [Candidatus Odinarchaeota archaeon]